MLPDVSGAIDAWAQTIELQTITQTVVNYRPVNTPVSTYPLAVVQPAQKEKLNPGIVDYSLHYVTIHSNAEIKIGDFIVYNSTTYKIVDGGDFSDYGYSEVIGEQVK